jgi:hypothetical protein
LFVPGLGSAIPAIPEAGSGAPAARIPRIKRLADSGGCIIKGVLDPSPIGAFQNSRNVSQIWFEMDKIKRPVPARRTNADFRTRRFSVTTLSASYDYCYRFPCIALP